MKVDTRIEILDLEGRVVLQEGQPLTVGMMCENALLHPNVGDPANADEKVRRFQLAMDFHQAQKSDGIVELDLNTAKLVKSLIGVLYGPLAVGRLFEQLDTGMRLV